MASISSSTNTAFDVPTLVSQLMAVERKPIDDLNTKISSYQTKISSFGTLSSLISTLQGSASALSSSLSKTTATPSNAAALASTSDSTAVPGTYSVNVSQLAQAQNLVAAGQTSSNTAIGNGTPTTLTFDFGTISGGTLTNGIYSGASFTSNGNGTASVVIDSTNNTLEGIRDAINSAGMGVTATLVNDGSGTPWRLALTSTESGATNSLKITTSGGDGTLDNLLAYDPAGTQNMTQTQAAQNASLTVNGIAITSASNTVSGAIQGVTLSLQGITASPAALTVARDATAMKTAASAFVDAYNALATQMKSRSAYGLDGANSGTLAGDGTLRLMQDQLRGIFNTPATGGIMSSLAEVGIAFQKDGTLKLDDAKFDTALASNFADVKNLFASPGGFATRIASWAQTTLQPGGMIETRTQSLNRYIQQYNDQIDRLEKQMTALEKKYTTEYTNLNLLLSRMNTTSTFLTQQLLTQQSSDK
ncbi:flagellar filament capping protein FliD [Betaproteobacteria bacterium SCN1]|jgi:flagellar hook-associated protein 2|nr:flagellar filament capping protein FliD [Betaproteobacteria bacterium SCN1]